MNGKCLVIDVKSYAKHAVHIGEEKVSILQAIDMLISQYRSYVLEECEEVDLPQILPIEIIKQIKE